jgi:hypothetical protein
MLPILRALAAGPCAELCSRALPRLGGQGRGGQGAVAEQNFGHGPGAGRVAVIFLRFAAWPATTPRACGRGESSSALRHAVISALIMGSPARRLLNPITRCRDQPRNRYAGTDDGRAPAKA